MEDRPQIGIREVLAIVKRRFWWIVIPVFLGPILGWVVSLKIKPVYTSQAFVLVEQQKVPDAFVPSVVTDQLENRLMTMKDQILSRSRLEPIVRRLNLYNEDAKRVPIEVLVSRLRKSITVTPIRPEGSNSLRGFYVAASTDQPRLAQEVCTEVLSMFTTDSLKARAQRAEDTTSFLSGQLAEAKRKLDDSDAKLAAFKSQYFGRLPTDEQSNLQMLATLSTQLEAANQAVAQAQQQKVIQEAMIAQQVSSQQASAGGSNSPSDLERELTSQRARLVALQARYTAEFPDVIKAKAEIQSLEQQLAVARKNRAETAPATAPSVIDTPELAQLRVSLKSAESNIRLRQAEQVRLERQIGSVQARVRSSPMVEEQFKELSRDYEVSQRFYNDLLSKKSQSEMVTDLERSDGAEQFRVVDPPDLPASPSSPKKIKFVAGGLAMGLLLGLALAFWFEMKERFIRTEEDVQLYLGLPTLAGISNLQLK